MVNFLLLPCWQMVIKFFLRKDTGHGGATSTGIEKSGGAFSCPPSAEKFFLTEQKLDE
ncbi:MAG: hypothetical protein NZ928_00275 [Endomicrobia bacterium]|nr:hypothetical protein [Endomicrobiia bacterium]MDW8055589.1 hypothetical protein [Elusimicrobiota bacterium]